MDRRRFLRTIAAPAAVALPALVRPHRLAAAASADRDGADSEGFWRSVREAFDVDPRVVNLDAGGAHPAAEAVQRAMNRHWRQANRAPAHRLATRLAPLREGVREGLAALFGVEAEEIALTRNASEGLEICQLGLPLRAGDEVLTTDQDYPRMLATFEQRVRRDGIVLRRVPLPVLADDDEVVDRFAAAISPRTRLILVCQVINLTGQVLPVRRVVDLARPREIPVVVDGAHGFGHLPAVRAELDCDYYATSLHKWLGAPLGTGMLFVRRDKIRGLWPLMAAPERLDHDIRKLEEVGTRPIADQLAVGEAIALHRHIGPQRKADRLVALRDRWARRLREVPGVRLLTSLEPGRAGGMATLAIDGVDPGPLARHLWLRHRILVAAIRHPAVSGIRVAPPIHTSPAAIDRLADVLEAIARAGSLPTTAGSAARR